MPAATKSPDASERHARPSALRPARFARSAATLALAVLAIHGFALERALGLGALAWLALGGFCVHAWLPARAKAPFFLALSLAAFALVLSPARAALVVLVALPLVGVCHLPLALRWRAALLVLCAAVLALSLVGRIPSGELRAVVPVVAALLMFRTVVYLYDEATRPGGASAWMRLSYFFLLPNACFLLFPVVDWRTFQRTYYERPAHELHERGLSWILRGVVHLLLYRLVYLYLTPTFAEVQDLAGVARFAASSFLLYLRISGQFHLIVGLLLLFGFGLPETNHRWLCATSFTDCWRRINVYWIEFMKKVVYYPAFVRLRGRGTVFAMASATALTFLVTWLLHGYQWFWLHGALPLATDGLFWGAAGALALFTMLVEARRPRPALAAGPPTWGRALLRSAQGLGVFCLVALAWSLWCSASPAEWLELVAHARRAPREQVLALAGGAALVLAVATLAQRLAPAPLGRAAVRAAHAPATGLALAALLALSGLAPVQAALGPRGAAVLAAVAGDTLNRRDADRRVAGYYDRLIDREGFGGRAAEERGSDPDDPEVFNASPLAASAEGPLRYELAASAEETFQDALVTTNRWGMRDREYALEKPAGTLRVAVLGACYEMGGGVADDQVWEEQAERRLNGGLAERLGRPCEILNFSVPGYDLLQLVTLLREKVPPFGPDLVLVSNHVRSSVDFVLRRNDDPSAWPAGLQEMIERTRERRDVDWEAELEGWAFAQIAAASEAMGARAGLMSVPPLETLLGLVTPELRERIAGQLARARAQGLLVLDLGSAFDGRTFEEVALPGQQRSPNALGHRLLAQRFCEVLLALPGVAGGR